MTLQGGDREFGHGDQVTVVYDDGTPAVGGEAVYVTGRSAAGNHPTVELATDSHDADGVLADGATQGDAVQVVMHGIVHVRVEGGDNASAGDTVSTSSTTEGVLSTDGAGPAEYRVLEGEKTDDESGREIALVRFEN